MKKDDIVRRREEEGFIGYSAWMHLSVNTDYTIYHILDNGLIVLEGFLMLVHEDELIKMPG